jgi:ABC-type uncharacterized transport system permease subunit
MNRLSKANALKIAAVLSLALGIVGFVYTLPELGRGPEEIETGPVFIFSTILLVISILRIIGAYGAWHRQRWGIVLTLLTNLTDAILAAPGLFFAPTFGWWLSAVIGVVVGMTVIGLCLWRDERRVTTEQISTVVPKKTTRNELAHDKLAHD